ncbi:imidazole glycerol phosphate synthase subunit HisH [Dyadobacter alkalitolerans]|uniref:imidazole glycerol phosphate synthase subunit HisH n=1 Tax=Dyadobacter alkalitolerans TaxID=492736 RepID=UPI0004193CAE|nr:imidazole glycerol phosphate synthase subunit HisH [Dyadobacter alkalitolerans]
MLYSPEKTVIIDYGMGNLRSVLRKCERVGKSVTVSGNPEVIALADKLILPGVGHFANGVKNLEASGIWDVLNQKVLVEKTPILGICLGMQLMARFSEEGNVAGLGWFDAEVMRFNMLHKLKHKVPHMGWNSLTHRKDSLLLDQLPAEMMFYFVHSYHVVCARQEDILTTTDYEHTFTSAIQKGHIYGTQFHPEKSHDSGEQLLANFLASNIGQTHSAPIS